MHCTLLIPDLLLPRELGGEHYAGLRTAALETLLARGTTASRAPVSREQWLCDALGIRIGQDVPAGAALYSAAGGDPGADYWLCADPVHLRADRSRLIIAGRMQDIDAAHAREMIDALNQHFARDGIEFRAPAPNDWYVRSAQTPRLTTTPLAQAVNRDVEPNLPRGADALAWHRVINEAQMILHGLPANAAREERGAPPVNSIWLWGGGSMPACSNTEHAVVWSRDTLTRALAAAAGAVHHELPADCAAWLAAATGEDHLLVCGGPADALREADIAAWREAVAALDAEWIAPLLAALRARRIAALRLVGCARDSLLETALARSDLRRFWRRGRPLFHYAVAA